MVSLGWGGAADFAGLGDDFFAANVNVEVGAGVRASASGWARGMGWAPGAHVFRVAQVAIGLAGTRGQTATAEDGATCYHGIIVPR